MNISKISIKPEDVSVAILCGGKGTRLNQNIPKCLVSIGGKTVLERIISNCSNQGFKKFVLCEGFGADQVRSAADLLVSQEVCITHSKEDQPMGTAGALLLAENYLSPTFIAIQGDLVFDTNLLSIVEFHERNLADITILTQQGSHPQDMDLVKVSQNWVVNKMYRGIPDDMKLCNAGIFVINKDILKRVPKHSQIESDMIKPLFPEGKIKAYFSSEYLQDIGTPERLKKCQEKYVQSFKKRPAVFLDRDGVLVYDLGHMTLPEQIKLIPGAANAVQILNQLNIPVIVVTNQSVVARGKCTLKEAWKMNDYLQYLLLSQGAFIDKFYLCPHHPFEGREKEYVKQCNCRKPAPGMLFQASKELNLDLSQSIMIGNNETDIIAGKSAGCKTYFVSTAKDSTFSSLGEIINKLYK